MADAKVVIPNTRIPSVLGTLNIIFGILLLLSSLVVVGWTLAAPQLVKMVTPPDAQNRQEARKAELRAREADLRKKSEAERDPDARARLRQEIDEARDELKSIEVAQDDLSGRDMKDPRVAVPFWTDHCLGILLNALMVASGAGLVALRPWGRRLAIQVAVAKVAKLAVFTLLAVFLTIPLQAVRVRQAWARVELRSRGPAPFGSSAGNQIAQVTAIYSTLVAVGYGSCGVIYPLLSLWLLSKRSTRAAFEPRQDLATRKAGGLQLSDLPQ
jgi:hypothetical protein